MPLLSPSGLAWACTSAFTVRAGLGMYLCCKAIHEKTDVRVLLIGEISDLTKESLLYRELFEQSYPGQAEMIPDFWMPNREWAGCDVSDPSARVLSNYGGSGA